VSAPVQGSGRPGSASGGIGGIDPEVLDAVTRRVLDFEGAWRAGRISKDRAIRRALGISPTRYRQLLVRALDRPEALAYRPMVVGRLARLREARQRRRAVARLGHAAHPPG
jgi:hypothetical protein